MRKENADAENLSMFNSQSYFELFKIKEDFFINKQILHENFIELQKIFHPDKQLNKSNGERLAGINLSQIINKAYDILNDDKKRAEYLLSLHNIIINQEEGNNISLDPTILNEILEINENPENFDILALKEECWNEFKNNFTKDNFSESAQAIIKLQYLNKIKNI